MAEGGPPALQPLLVEPATPVPLVQPPAQPDDLIPPTEPGQHAHGMSNWSHFLPEFSSKLEEDAEVYLLRTNDWMETHNFPEDVKVQRFCLTLTGEARLWCELLRLMAVHSLDLQDRF